MPSEFSIKTFPAKRQKVLSKKSNSPYIMLMLSVTINWFYCNESLPYLFKYTACLFHMYTVITWQLFDNLSCCSIQALSEK